ncbi:hypothetical protein AVEN_251382-1, partial [Araneus ventricosus]
MTRATPELAPPPTERYGVWPATYDVACRRPNTDGSSVESGFEPGTHRPRSRDITTKPSWPH